MQDFLAGLGLMATIAFIGWQGGALLANLVQWYQSRN